MKKSEIYKLAQVAVMQFPLANSKEKLEVLRELMNMEDVAKYTEDLEATKEGCC